MSADAKRTQARSKSCAGGVRPTRRPLSERQIHPLSARPCPILWNSVQGDVNGANLHAMEIFVTNLPWSTERRVSISAQLDRLELRYEMPRCVIGAELSESEVEERCDINTIRRLPWFTRAVIGCTLTCFSIYRQIVERDLRCALYLEDDTILPTDLPRLLDRIEAEIVDGEVVLLYYLGHDVISLSAHDSVLLTKEYSLRYPMHPGVLSSGSAFVVTQSAARHMIERNTPIRMSPDCWGYFLDIGALASIRCVHPMPVNTADYRSTLSHFRESKALGGLAAFIDLIRPFPLYQLLQLRRRLSKENRRKCRVVDEPSPVARR
jgi:GR25 family glycosyltransferase involved in LPS biosynthesis